MPSLAIVHLSDLHIGSIDDPLLAKSERIARAALNELGDDVDTCVIALTGDATSSGREEQFIVVRLLLDEIRKRIASARPGLTVSIVTVPGNHDCDLTSEDEEARRVLRESLGAEMPKPSIAARLLGAQDAYFAFAAALDGGVSGLTKKSPYYCHHDVNVGGALVRFHLLNSSWTSLLRESDDLRFPLEAFRPPQGPEAALGVAVIHHPINWFLMPTVRSELRDLIEAHCDLVLTGHEHQERETRRMSPGGPNLNYLEGGSLQGEAGDSLTCEFSVTLLNLSERTQCTTVLRWVEDHFEPADRGNGPLLIENPRRIDRRLQLRGQFRAFLDEMDDPLTHPRLPQLRLSDIYSYPDLRKLASGAEDNHPQREQRVTKRVRSEDVVDELSPHARVFITGGDRAGKTSICRRLVLDLHAQGCAPVLLNGRDMPKMATAKAFRSVLHTALKTQYERLSPGQFEQLEGQRRVLILDDLQDGPSDPVEQRGLLQLASSAVEQIIVVASDDFYLELLSQRGQDASVLLSYERYDICELGYQRLETLAHRWMSLGVCEPDPASIRDRTLELCEQVQSVLALAGLPHTPWLLLVVLEQSDQAEQPFYAARSGNYGHLYHAVITVALSRSRMPQFDLAGKFIYLANLAHRLHAAQRPTISRVEASEFHRAHCERFGLSFDYDRVIGDLVATRMLRLDDGEVSFRSKWVYCFFVAWWLDRNRATDEAKETILRLTTQLYHETSANILVFLAHFGNDPLVINQMREAASNMFSDAPLATLAADVAPLSQLNRVGSFFQLPPTTPDANRRLLQDLRDESTVRRERKSLDGRYVDAAPDPDPDERAEVNRRIRLVRAALKTIPILGQVLRNGVTSLEETTKRAILQEILALGRRVMGHIFSFTQWLPSTRKTLRSRVFRILVDSANESPRAPCARKHTLAELRNMWTEAGMLADNLWFDLNWMAALALVRRMASSAGHPLLDGTLSRLIADDDALPNRLVQLVIRLNRRGRSIPVADMIELHRQLQKSGNTFAAVALGAIAWQRLLLFDTDATQAQAICRQMGIKVPAVTLDTSQKKFGAGGKGPRRLA